MKQLFSIVILISMLLGLSVPDSALAQQSPPTVEQIQQVQNQANQAGQSAASSQAQANSLEAQAASQRQAAAAAQQQSSQLAAQAQQMRVDATNAAITTANQAKAKADEAAGLYAEAARLQTQATNLNVKAAAEWKTFYALTAQAIQLALNFGQAALVNMTRQSLNAAQMSGVVAEQRNTIAVLSNQIYAKDRLILGSGLLALALVATIVWLVIRYSQRAMNQLAIAFSKTAKTKDTAIVQDDSVRTYRVLSEVADGPDPL
jgi:hypothetical protein